MKKVLIWCILVVLPLAAITFYDEELSENFVNRWSFQELCDHHFDPRYVWPTPTQAGKPVSFSSQDVKPGDLIFVRDFEYYLEHKHHHINVPHFIMTHGEYLDSFKEEYLELIDGKTLLAWFTVHPCSIEHERVVPLPLGVVQYKEMYDEKKKTFKNFMRLRKRKKDKLLYKNFTEWRMPERTRIRQLFEQSSFCTKGEPCEFGRYISELADHRFVLSPPGLGPDCYRVWESLLVGTIPIVQHSYLDSLYEGLPILFIDSWEEVTQKFLEEQYEKITNQAYSQKKLFMNHWIDRIDEVRKKYWPQGAGVFIPIRDKKRPNCFRARSDGFSY